MDISRSVSQERDRSRFLVECKRWLIGCNVQFPSVYYRTDGVVTLAAKDEWRLVETITYGLDGLKTDKDVDSGTSSGAARLDELGAMYKLLEL